MDHTFQAQISDIKGADMIIGIPSYNSVRTISHVLGAVTAGLTKYFPKAKAVLVVSDGGSADGTQEEVNRTRIEPFRIILTLHSVDPVHKLAPPYHGIPGKENAFRNIFEAAKLLNVKACALVDSDLRSITPEWIELLFRPVYEKGFDYVVPIYARHKFDGSLTHSIVYPLDRALYGKRVQQLIGGDFGLSGELANFYLTKDVWKTDVARFGIDIWMTTVAVAEGYKVCQSFLGPKIYDSKGTGGHLGSMFAQIVSPVFRLMKEYENRWEKIKGSEPVPTFGLRHEMKPEPIPVNVKGMIQSFRLGVRELMEIWRKILAPETVLGLESMSRLSDEALAFPQDLWSRVVYDFATGYHKGSVHGDHLLKSMIPLYLAWVASFVKENQESSMEEVGEKIESLCRVFEEMKPYLTERWNPSGRGGE
jgi:glucosylglycerate synthase